MPNRELEELVARASLGDQPPEPDEDSPALNFVWTKMRLEPLHFERLMKAVARIRHAHGGLDMSLSQCLMAMADRVLPAHEHEHGQDSATSPTHMCHTPSPPVRIVAHRCPSCERAWLETQAGRPELSDTDRQWIEGDAELVSGHDSASTPGHISRSIPPATRRAVLIRDGHRCQVPGCRCRDHLALHHIRFRSQGGDHQPHNLVTVCWAHHDMIHRGVLQQTRDPDGTLHWRRGPGEPQRMAPGWLARNLRL